MISSEEIIRLSGDSANQKEVILFFKALQKDSQFKNAQIYTIK